jgi:hypothetical protein
VTSHPTSLCNMSSWGSSAFYYEPRGNSILSHVLVLMIFHFAIYHHLCHVCLDHHDWAGVYSKPKQYTRWTSL